MDTGVNVPANVIPINSMYQTPQNHGYHAAKLAKIKPRLHADSLL